MKKIKQELDNLEALLQRALKRVQELKEDVSKFEKASTKLPSGEIVVKKTRSRKYPYITTKVLAFINENPGTTAGPLNEYLREEYGIRKEKQSYFTLFMHAILSNLLNKENKIKKVGVGRKAQFFVNTDK